MTILTMNRKELEKKIGKITEKIEDRISMFGTPIDKITDEEVSVEVFPNRPDLLSIHGFSRAILAFLNKKPGLKNYEVNKPEKNYKVVIDKSVKKVRPYAACAIVRDLKLDNEKIKEIIDIQEKLHSSYGRKRKKSAIGIYPLEHIKLPIYYLAKKPETIKFKPLESKKEMTGLQILSQHPAGREYGNLLKDYETFPVFQDANGGILSLPPIINSHKTGKITEQTKDVFIECTGFSREHLEKEISMIVCSLADMGGRIYAMEIEDKYEKKKYLSPNLEPEKMQFSIDSINKTLGVEFKEKDIKNNLEKMGIGYENNTALIPSYRTDILHEVDLSEEVAIAHGYENFSSEIPQISTIGEEDTLIILGRKISEVLIGLNLLEISTFHLSTKEKQFKNIGIKEFHPKLIEIINSKTENDILRTSLLAQSIQVLSENSDSAYPQRIFELGRIFFQDEKEDTEIGEKESLCITLCHEKANFTEIKQVLDYLMRMFDKKYEIKETTHPSFIDGRAGSIFVNNKEVGVIGEITPFVLKNNGIKMPAASLEMNVDALH